jgi:hypothetical protein
MQPILMIVPAAALLAGIGTLMLGLRVFRARHAAQTQRPPAPENALPAPGQAMLARIEHLDREVSAFTIAAFALPILVCAAILVPLGTGRPEFNPFSVGAAAAIGAGAYGYYLTRLIQLMAERRNARRDYDGKTAVGLALSGLAQDGADGWQVFHEVPAEAFSIDHVVVGKSGVFAVEVKTRAKPEKDGRVAGATVAYNGHVLFFPRTTDEETVVRAKRKADWLSEWLGRAIGEEVAARAVVAVPGWYVKRTTSEGIPVVNPRQIPSLFKFIVPRPLDAVQVVRITAELEQRCRAPESTPAAPPGEPLPEETVLPAPGARR